MINATVTRMIQELEFDVISRNAQGNREDPGVHTLFIVLLELESGKPDIGYINSLLCSALKKPFTAIH